MVNDSGFQCLKLILTIVYTLGVIGAIGLFMMCVVGLVAINNRKINDQEEQEIMERERYLWIFSVVLSAITLVLSIVAVVGIIQESRCIVITLTMFSFIGLIGYVAIGSWVIASTSLIGTIMLGFYAWQLNKKNKANFESQLLPSN